MATLSIPRPLQEAKTSEGSKQDKAAPDGNTPLRSPQVGKPQAGSKPRSKRAVYYPTGDGKPMAEDEPHLNLMNYSIPALRYRLRNRPDVYVAGNNFLYYEEGNPKARVSPDCYVALGVEPKGRRRFYKVWEENGIAPAVIFEFTSKKTKKEDLTIKKSLYEQVLRVQEYFQFDPTGDYLKPRLQGQRLHEGVYQPIELNDNRMFSEQLGLELVMEGETLRFYDPASGEWLRTYEQAETQRLAQEQRAQAEAQRAQAEAQRAEAADQRADSEKQRAESAEAELARLRAELEALRQQK